MTTTSPGAQARPRPAERVAVVLGVAAGVLYNSWPLGFRVDTEAMRGTYVSALEIPGRHDAHLFVGCDVVTGLLAIAAAVLLRGHRLVAGGLVAFGIGNILEAAIPIHGECAVSVAACGTGPDAMFAPHDLASIVSVLGLALALCGVRDRGRWVQIVIAVWVASGLFMVASVTFVFWVTLSQALFLVACGVALAVVPVALVRPPGDRAASGAGG